MDATDLTIARALETVRDGYTDSLRTLVTVFRDQLDEAGASTNEIERVGLTYVGIAYHGTGNNAFIRANERQATNKTPGSCTISFDEGYDVRSGDYVVEGDVADWPPPADTLKIKLGLVDSYDPRRFGIQVPGEVMRKKRSTP